MFERQDILWVSHIKKIRLITYWPASLGLKGESDMLRVKEALQRQPSTIVRHDGTQASYETLD